MESEEEIDSNEEINNDLEIDMVNSIEIQKERKNENIMDMFGVLDKNQLSLKENEFYNKIYEETNNIYSYLMESIKGFHNIFQQNLLNFEDALHYLEKISIPDKCVCAGVIETIPGWRCVNCSKYENTIYCNDCYKKSKHLHKNHTLYFLYSSGGMCDCGDPESLYTYCPDHSGPYKNQKEINQYISKVFPNDIIENLKKFFDDFFWKFSKYFILTEKCELFYTETFNEYFENMIMVEKNENDINNQKNDINLLKNNVCVVFQNFIHFLRLISQKNLGILHLIALYFIRNHLVGQNLDENYKTNHKCITINENDINILHEDGQNHICKCPFLRLLISNWREPIKSKDNENEEFLLSFPHNLALRSTYCIIFFFLYKQALLNNNVDIIYNRNQFYLEEATELIGRKTNLIEKTYEIYYEYFKKYIKSPKIRDQYGSIIEEQIKEFKEKFNLIVYDTQYYSKPKMRNIMTEKVSIVKTIIEYMCLIHNELEFKSIVPHPQFQNKEMSTDLMDIELALLSVIEEINMYIQWDKNKPIKVIFKYLINKIINQEKEGIKILKEKEYSFHLILYRCFGLLINAFCFNYAIRKNYSLIDSIDYFKSNIFNSKDEMESLINTIFHDYFRFFGFLGGSKNNFFNYYEGLNNYPYIYLNDKRFLKMDFTLLKYLLAMTTKNFDINEYLQLCNIENVYSLFDNLLLSNNTSEIKEEKEDNDKMIIEDNANNNTNYISFDTFMNNNFINRDNPQINQLLGNFIQYNRLKENNDENNCIMQLGFLLELIIIFMKDDSSPYWTLMRFYEETVSSQTKRDLFNFIRKNEYAKKDLENILKEKIIHEIIEKDNLIDLRKLKKNLDKYLLNFFDENEFNKILDELTLNKINGETKIFYLKDSCLKYLDMNYYISPREKSKAQRYIMEFKKDIVKLNNSYYFNPSYLTFDLFKITYEKILLNKNNLELIIKVIEKLLSDNNNNFNTQNNIKSMKNTLLPIIINYLSIFSIINTKSFIKFKIKNKEYIDKLTKIFSDLIKNDKSNEIVEKDLKENIKELIKQLNYYQIIDIDIKSNKDKLNDYDYNTNYIEKIKEINKNNSLNSINENTKNDLKLSKANNLKMRQKFKMLMNKKNNLFSETLLKNNEGEVVGGIENEKEIDSNSEDEIMCFYCRNPIKLNLYEQSYGKTGLLIKDYFYINSVKASAKNELLKLIENKSINDSNLYDNILNDYKNKKEDKLGRIISCGHYFHSSCFKKGCKQYFFTIKFSCPLCLKEQNILIPPLNNFYNKYDVLKSEKIKEIFDEKKERKDYEISLECNLFNEMVFNFIKDINLYISVTNTNQETTIEYSTFLDNIFINYKGYLNFFENVFYFEGTTFHKQQQIDTMQNIILSLRYLLKINFIKEKEVINYIKKEISDLINGLNINEGILIKFENMYYINLLEKIILSLSILFDYDELKEIFKYIIYIFLTYITFGLYLRYLIINKNNVKNINTTDFIKYIENNNEQMINHFYFLLQKLSFSKFLIDFSNKNDNLINTFINLNMENLLSLLNIDFLYKLIVNEKKEINYMDILKFLPKTFNLNDPFFKEFKISSNYINNIIEICFINIKNYKYGGNLIKELIVQFSPIKFNLIYLDNNIFDWIERNLEKKCIFCSKTSKYDYICLICGNKICHTKSCNKHFEHIKECSGYISIFIDMDNMKIVIESSAGISNFTLPLYVNKNGVGPNGYEMSNEFNLSLEKKKLTIKNYACNDIHFN